MWVTVKLATNYKKNLADVAMLTILLSKHIRCIATDELLIDIEFYLFGKDSHE